MMDELLMERDEPEKLIHKVRLTHKGRIVGSGPTISRYGEEGPDKAYERAYLDHDRKRAKR